MGTSVREYLYGEVATFRVADVQEAVELAVRLQDEGRYDWFRGQVRDWPPYPSLLRPNSGRDDDTDRRRKLRYMLFCKWLGQTPELMHLLEERWVHEFFAIAQHYGIATNYVDFTTDPAVAGFFSAATAAPPDDDGNSCIYLLNTEELRETWSCVTELDEREGAQLETVTIDVSNLWRLQAQRGRFIYTNYRWDVDYPLDRIVFPYTGPPGYPTSEQIYPRNKSSLEQLLDQYFSLEGATFAQAQMRKLLKAVGQPDNFVQWETFADGYYPEAFDDGTPLSTLDSWSRAAAGAWSATLEPENFFDVAGPTLRLHLPVEADAEKLRRSVEFSVGQILRAEPDVRAKVVDWDFSALPEQVSAERLVAAFRLAWNGMRRLPYTDGEIGGALGSIVALLVTGAADPRASDEHRFAQCHGAPVEVGFSYADKSGSRGWIARRALEEALRPDMSDILAPSHRHRANDVRELFGVIYNPSLMFEFEAFTSAFARQVIPSQIVAERTPVLFDPVRLVTFGIP
jgi:hypothetical protein